MKSLIAAGAMPGCLGVAAIAAALTSQGAIAPATEVAAPGAQSGKSSTAVADAVKIAATGVFGDDIIAIEDAELGICMIFAPGTPEDYMQKRMDMLREQQGLLRFEPNDRWGGFGNNDPVSLTYSFPPDGTTVSAGVGNSNEMFTRWNAAFAGVGGESVWKQKFRQSFDAWEAVTGNIYTEVSDDGAPWPGSSGNASRGQIRIVSTSDDGAGGVLAFNYFPSTFATGDMHMDADDLTAGNFLSTANNYRFLRNVIIHENGHGMGLNHSCPVQGTKLMEPFINTGFDGPQLDDVLGMQFLYGDNFEPNNNTATAATPGETGILPDDSVSINRLSIDSAGDPDLYRVSVTGESTIQVIVTPQSGSYLAGPQLGSGCPTPGGGWTSENVVDNADLAIEILNSGGQQIGLRDQNGLGLGETLPGFTLPGSGDYFIRISGSDWTDVQPYIMTVEITGGGCPGDLSGDGQVNGADLGILLGAWGPASTFPPADLNGDGQINGADFGLLLGCWTG